MSTEDARDIGLGKYAAFYAALDPGKLAELRRLCTPDVHFRDPFNEVRGVEAMIRIFEKMYQDADQIAFEVVDAMRNGDRAMLLWVFYCRPKSLRLKDAWRIEGASEIHLTADGRIKAHLDHWDSGAQFYARLPLIGPVIRYLRRRLHVA
ncbi:MAG: nuclear transport factor 2 family protein [Alphaproteobacteria bacterium]|nr:nuclear transport factor 2 family protein [Alphaproteobacteria bacterium]